MTRRALVALALALLVAATWHRIRLIDELPDQGYVTTYPTVAARIASGDVPHERLPSLSPAYVWLLAGIENSVGLDFLLLRTAQIIAVSLVALLAALIAARYGGLFAAVFAALLILGSRAPLLNATEAGPETLILLLNTASLFFLLRPSRPRKPVEFLVAGVLMGLSATAQPLALVAAAGIALWFLFEQRRGENPRLRAPLFAAGVVFPVLVVIAVSARLTGDAVLMDPGPLFYEGMNPSATGYSGVQPRSVNDLEASLPTPDARPGAYGMVASKAAGRTLTRDESNRYWMGKSLAYARAHPGAAVRLTLRKMVYAAQNHDAWDLSTIARKERQTDGPWVPFAFLFASALGGVALRRRTETAPLLIYTAASYGVLVAFYVTARQRNAMVPALAILAAIGIARCFELARIRKHGIAIATAVIVTVVTALLSLDTHGQREDTWSWRAASNSTALQTQAAEAESSGDATLAATLRAQSALYLTAHPAAADPALVRELVLTELRGREPEPARLFDLALALQRTGTWDLADTILGSLEEWGYVPRRGNRAVHSVAYYRAKSLLHSGRAEEARQLLLRAGREAAGDVNVLALAERMGIDRRRTSRLIDALHDPFTAAQARKEAASS
ncbi:MAG: glycosyltransferase family 39 protein [Thermoanaerobaculia bacterium]